MGSREEEESAILRQLLPLLPTNGRIISYIPDTSLEVDPLPLVESCPLPVPSLFTETRVRAQWFFPKINPDGLLVFCKPKSWKKGKFGIWEPEGSEFLLPEEADLVLLPSLGFSSEGARLGRGGGFYDKALATTSKEKLLGISFSKLFPVPFQPEEHDVRVGRLILETKLISFLD